MRTVDVDDAAYIVAKMKNGAYGTINVSKIAAGTNDEFIVEIYGEKGAVKFNLMDPNWVWFYDNTQPDQDLGGYKGFTQIESVQRFEAPGGTFPSPKLPGGWLRAHVHSMYSFLNCVHDDKPCRPDLADGAYIQHVMQKAYESHDKNAWMNI
jgi:predicted dehydrogenase